MLQRLGGKNKAQRAGLATVWQQQSKKHQVCKTVAAPAGSAEAFRQAPQLVAIRRSDYCCRTMTSRRFCAQQDSLLPVKPGVPCRS